MPENTPETTSAEAQAVEQIKAQGDQITKMAAQVELLAKQVAGGAERTQPFGVPAARTGEDPLTSRGFSFAKLIGAAAGVVSREDAKVEIDISNKLSKHWTTNGFVKGEANSILVPFSSQMIADTGAGQLAAECHQISKAGIAGYDPDYTRWAMAKYAPGVAKDMN